MIKIKNNFCLITKEEQNIFQKITNFRFNRKVRISLGRSLETAKNLEKMELARNNATFRERSILYSFIFLCHRT